MFIPRSIASAIDRVARQSIGKDWNLYAGLLEHWAEIVGPDYAAVTTPVKLTFPVQPTKAQRCDGTLCIRLPKGLAMEFTFKNELIRQRVNGYFGYAAIARIMLDPVAGLPPQTTVAHIPVPERDMTELRSGVEPVEDMALRDALLNLGEAMLRGRDRSVPARLR